MSTIIVELPEPLSALNHFCCSASCIPSPPQMTPEGVSRVGEGNPRMDTTHSNAVIPTGSSFLPCRKLSRSPYRCRGPFGSVLPTPPLKPSPAVEFPAKAGTPRSPYRAISGVPGGGCGMVVPPGCRSRCGVVEFRTMKAGWLAVLTVPLLLSFGLQENLRGLFSRGEYRIYLSGEEGEDGRLEGFLASLDREQNPETAYILILQVVRLLKEVGRSDTMCLFLTDRVYRYPDDPYSGYYLYLVATHYMGQNASSFASHYFERVLKNHADLVVRGVSTHYLALLKLAELEQEPSRRANYYRELLARFGTNQAYANTPMSVSLPATYYNLAVTYEELGEWEEAIEIYRIYLRLPEERDTARYREVSEKVAFYDHPKKDWAYRDLYELKQALQSAIWARSPSRINRYRAQVNFFARSWEQREDLSQEDIDSFFNDISVFMVRRPSVMREFDVDSNNQEAYLATFGWSYRIPTWYFYFRRISYPGDPEIHGKWEWSGIYFGEKPFAGRG